MEILLTNWIKNAFKKKSTTLTLECKYSTECIKLLQLVLDNEASEEEKKYYSENIEKCMYCAQYFQLEKEIKFSLQTKIPKKATPPELLESIRYQIHNSL